MDTNIIVSNCLDDNNVIVPRSRKGIFSGRFTGGFIRVTVTQLNGDEFSLFFYLFLSLSLFFSAALTVLTGGVSRSGSYALVPTAGT